MRISAGYLNLAMRLQEAAEQDLSASDICARLRDAINDAFRGTGTWAYYIDHFGDAESGEVIYSVGGDTRRASYEISGGGDTAAKCVIDIDSSENVVPRTIYEVEADEADQYAAMEESLKAEKLYTALPLYERFISKSERDAADTSDFAGKGKSFPILKPGDIMAAVRSMGRAGSSNLGPSGIKSRIIAIAKRKGWTKYLPKAWRNGEGTKEAAPATQPSGLRLVESAASFLSEIPLREARVNYPIKLISPGTGTTAHYPAAVLEGAAGKFKAGTLMFWNHPTASEEASRPEGDLNNLAAITTSDARWDAAGPKGPGLYAEAKVMADYAQKVEERAPHIGLSIRAGGTASGRTVDGKPELKSIDYVESVDYVTKAGRGGLALAEAAREAGILPAAAGQEVEVTEAEVTRLVEAAVTAALTQVNQKQQIQAAARAEGTRLLESINLPPASRVQVLERVIAGQIPVKDNALDAPTLKALVEAEAVKEGQYLSTLFGDRARPVGLGTAASVTQIDAKEARQREKAEKKAAKAELREARDIFQDIGMPKGAAKAAADWRESA